MLNVINHCYTNKKVSSFYYDVNQPLVHLTGYISAFNDVELLIEHISIHGNYDGFILKRIEDIFRIDYNGEYEKKIWNLYRIKKQLHKKINILDKNDILSSVLDFCIDNKYIISLEFDESCISGFVKSYNKNYINLSIVNEYGIINGETIVDLNQIVSIAVDTDDEQDIKLLTMIDNID